MLIRFYNFAKRENSTKQPAAGSGTEYDVVLKDGSSLIQPTVILRLEYKPVYNYAYIADMDRFYFVDDIVNLSKNIWEISMHTDVLASFRVEITNAELYVLRAAADYDGNIIDNFYPVKVTKTNERVTVDSILNAGGSSAYANVNNGCFIVGIVGATGSLTTNAIYGSVTYYAFNRANFAKLISLLLDDDVLENWGLADLSDLTIKLQKSIIDPLQWIKSCVWVPIAYNEIDGTSVGQLYAFGMEISGSQPGDFYCKQISGNPPQEVLTTTITIPPHPMAASRGDYLNVEPFTRMQLLFPPFGNFELDTSVLTQADNLAITVYIDLITGAGTLRVGAEGDGQFLINAKTQVGVPINLTQVTHDYLSMFGGLIGGGISAGVGAATANPVGIIGGVVSAIGSVVNAFKPVVSSMGGNGGFSDLSGKPTLACQFYDIPDEDNANAGRPLCQVRRLGSLPGYILVREGDVEINGFGDEQAILKSYLEGGFYYE